MSSRIINIMVAFIVMSPSVFANTGRVVIGSGEGKTIEQAEKLALADLSRKIEVKVTTNVTTRNINGRQELMSDTISITDINLKESEREIIQTKTGYKVICSLNIDRYILHRLEEYSEYFDTFQKSDEEYIQLGNLYLAYKSIDDPILNSYRKFNESEKKELLNLALNIEKRIRGEIHFFVITERGSLVKLTPPQNWYIKTLSPKPVKFVHS